MHRYPQSRRCFAAHERRLPRSLAFAVRVVYRLQTTAKQHLEFHTRSYRMGTSSERPQPRRSQVESESRAMRQYRITSGCRKNGQSRRIHALLMNVNDDARRSKEHIRGTGSDLPKPCFWIAPGCRQSTENPVFHFPQRHF
jgi:hypothetical protein